ncbi:hypothetical protein M153_2660009805 [Pseudoloma neurophilia]|uniref:Uncharacterized protein n=1 Tax=Pseudoloma neurophilia TaxID=146866 RepID=A0A0R0LYN4_9MICR|nr:hypothetical protein M153_2660009805 [Pseudoloma neurophilia]
MEQEEEKNKLHFDMYNSLIGFYDVIMSSSEKKFCSLPNIKLD